MAWHNFGWRAIRLDHVQHVPLVVCSICENVWANSFASYVIGRPTVLEDQESHRSRVAPVERLLRKCCEASR